MSKTVFLDGGLGTMLQKNGMTADINPVIFGFENREVLKSIHRDYIEAGSDIFFCNSFSINRHKFQRSDITLEDAVKKSLEIAKEARNEASYDKSRKVQIAFDMSTLGELIEPMGSMTFEEAYDAYREIAIYAEKYGADLIIVETMTDLYELKAAVLAIKENTNLTVFTSMTFEKNGRTFTGVSLETMVATLEGLGVEAVGINCSLGPKEIYPMAERLVSLTDLPVLVKPNAGLPDPETGKYNIEADDFAEILSSYHKLGVAMLGGCCGTEPIHIKKLVEKVRELENYENIRSKDTENCADNALACGNDQISKNEYSIDSAKRCALQKRSLICSATKLVDIDGVRVVGERLNPTGKPKLKQALLDRNWDYILTQAIEQVDAGAEILDVNIGVPGLNQEEFFPLIIKKLQSVTDIPLQIDSSNPRAIEAALRVYNGKAIVNSVNGEEKNMGEILPIIKKYGAAVIGLTLDENGIPKTAEERVDIAKKILEKALSYGIKKEDIYIDCLTLTASVEQLQALETLKALHIVHDELGLKTTLGVSNISFGLPSREIINRTFLTMAMNMGLNLPIINPNNEDMISTVHAFKVLNNIDNNSEGYIEYIKNKEAVELKKTVRTDNLNIQNTKEQKVQEQQVNSKNTNAKNIDSENLDLHVVGNKLSRDEDNGKNKECNEEKNIEQSKVKNVSNICESDILYAIENGLKESVSEQVESLLKTLEALEIVNNYLIPALDIVGENYENGSIYLPQMLQSAVAVQSGFDVIKAELERKGEKKISLGKIALATVRGDIHDIGKNIVKVIMENYGFEIIDLGKDVPIDTVTKAVVDNNLKLVGLSALMTTTLGSMEKTISAIKAISPDCKVMVGGAVLTEDYAYKIGADYYCKDAPASVAAGRSVFEVK